MSEGITIETLKERLKQSKDYRGQLLDFVSVNGRVSESFPVEEYPGPLGKFLENTLEKIGKSDLYIHQGETVRNVWQGKNVFLCSNEGSGKSLSADLSSIMTVVCKHDTILYILPNSADLETRANILQKRIEKANWNWLIKATFALDAADLSLKISQSPDIVITVPNAIREYFLIQSTSAQYDIWFASLSLIVIEDVNFYSPQELTHLKQLIRALRFRLSTNVHPTNVLLTGTPVGSPERAAYSLLGQEPVVIATDYSPKNDYHLLFWIPTLESRNEEKKEVNIERANYLDEATAVALNLFEKGGKYLVWHSFAKLSLGELRRLRDAAEKKLGKLKIIFCHRLQELERNELRKFDGVLILGLPPDLARIKDLLGNLLVNGGVAVVIPPEDPLSYYVVKNPKQWDNIRLPELYVGDFPHVTRYYLLRAIASLPENRASLTRLEEIWGNSIMHYLDSLEEEGVLALSQGVITIDDRNGLIERASNLAWGAVEKRPVITLSFTRADGRTEFFNFDQALFPWLVFPGAVFYRANEKFQINNIDLSGVDVIPIQYAPEGTPVLTIPKVEIRVVVQSENVHEGEKESTENGGGGVERKTDFGNVHLLKLEVEEDFTGHGYFQSYSYPRREITISPSVQQKRQRVWGLRIAALPAHGLEHLIKIFLPTIIRSYSNLLSVVHFEDNTYVYSLFPESDGVIEYLFHNWETFARIIFEQSYELLKTCPCVEGCPQCLTIFDCISDNPPDKLVILRDLAKPLGKTHEVQTLIDFKKDGLKDGPADEKYREWKRRILDTFKNKLDLEIKRIVPLKGTTDLGGPIGVYTGKEVKIIYSLKEAKAVDVIAHEYAHNWEFDPGGSNISQELTGDGIPIGGKLVTEGFAQWVAFKILDFYGLVDYMRGISLWGADEYGLGFKLLRWFERNVAGFGGVIKFVKEGQFTGFEDNKMYDLPEIIKASGFEEEIMEADEKEKQKQKKGKKS